MAIEYRLACTPTPLHIVALNGHLEICSLIIGHIGVKKFDVDIQGTPMAAVVGRFLSVLLDL